MSWGFLVELRCSLPSRAWTALKKKRPRDFPLEEGWSRMRDDALRRYYFRPAAGPGAETPFGSILGWPIFCDEALREERREGATMHVRIALALERSLLESAGYLGALLVGVSRAGGRGSLLLVNDGTYVGEDGHALVAREGRLRKQPLRDVVERRDALLGQLVPDEDEDANVGEDAPRDDGESAAEPQPMRREVAAAAHDGAAPAGPADPRAALEDAIALYHQGSPHGARNRLSDHLVAGGAATVDVVSHWAMFLRLRVPKGQARLEAADRLIDVLRRHPELRAHAPLMENAVAFLNEQERASESVDLVLQAASEGIAWTPALATNAACSADVAGDVERARRLRAIVPSFASEPQLLENLAALDALLGDHETAFDELAACLALDPERRRKLAEDARFAVLRGSPRWGPLIAPG